MNRAHDRQQAAYKVQDTAWQRRSAAREKMSRAYDAKQAAHESQQEAWEELQRLRDNNGPRIGALREEHDAMFERIKELSSDIDRAFDRGDREEAFRMMEEVKGLRADIRKLPPQWRPLSAEINEAKEVHARLTAEFRPLKAEFDRLRDAFNSAKADHERAQREFQVAKAEFGRARETFNAAKAEHDRKQAEFRVAKTEAEKAAEAFQARLNYLREESAKKKTDKAAIAEMAGVPSQYWDDVWISIQGDMVNIYFGGVGEPNGPGHGHYVLDSSTGQVTYARDPFDDHGAHNFTDQPDTAWERPRADGRTNIYFNRGKQDGGTHGHVVEERHPGGDRTYNYVRDREGNVYKDDSKD